jgi:hypothetical protein
VPRDGDPMPREDTSVSRDDIKMIIDMFVERAAGKFVQYHDEHARRLAVLDQQFNALNERLDRLDLRLDEIEHATKYTKTLAGAAFASKATPPTVARPLHDLPRPLAIDRACDATPADGPQRVDLIEHGVTLFPQPGGNPQEAWENARAALKAVGEEGSAGRSIPRSRRPRRS